MNLWGVAVLELDSRPDHNKGPDQRTLHLSKDPSYTYMILDPSHTKQQTTNLLIVRPLFGSPNCACYWITIVLDQGFPPSRTINV